MRRVVRLMGLAAGLAVPSLLAAQPADKPVSFGASLGLSLPSGDLGEATNSGYMIAGHVFFKPAALQSVRFRGDVTFDKWAVKESGGDAQFRTLGFMANALYDFPTASAIRPYVLGGLGMVNARFEYDLGGFSGSTPTNTDLGFQVGGGLTFKLSGFDTFAEARYVKVTGDGDAAYIPISFGVRF